MLIGGLFVLNESPRFRSKGVTIRFALLSLCVVSYLNYLVPIMVGFVGKFPFVFAVAITLTLFYFLVSRLVKTTGKKSYLYRTVGMPVVATNVLFMGLYFFEAIPPVPISIQYMGVYHNVEVKDGDYIASYSRPIWKFWEHGDESFSARPGDKIYLFARIFAPNYFNDEIKVRWSHKGKRGWTNWDSIPINILGGRNNGFRGYTYKKNYTPGKWRVYVETGDGREVGRIGFEVTEDPSTAEREFRQDVF